MLDNLAGRTGLPSRRLLEDLRVLCGLEVPKLAEITDVFRNLRDELTEDAVLEVASERARSLRTDPETLRTAVGVAFFLWTQWGRRGLTRKEILSDLESLDLGPEQMDNLRPLLDAMEEKLGSLQKHRAESHAFRTGTPRVDSVVCVVDARAIFASLNYQEDLGEEQPYYKLDRFVPVTILEIVSELNDRKTTQAYLMTEETLEQLCAILGRAKKRLGIVKRKLSMPDAPEEGSND